MPLPSRPARRNLGLILAAFLAIAPAAQALMNFDGTRNQLFVFGGLTLAYDSNIYAEADGRGDYSLTAQAGTELKRKAGLIAIDFTAPLGLTRPNTVRFAIQTVERDIQEVLIGSQPCFGLLPNRHITPKPIKTNCMGGIFPARVG